MVSKKSRRIDAASLALIAAGGLCYVLAYMGMQALRAAPHDPNAPLFAGYKRYVRLTPLAFWGMASVMIGVAVALYAALDARRSRRTAGVPER
jgi:hypothetical protein